MSVVNLFARLPLEILENEIPSRLDLVGNDFAYRSLEELLCGAVVEPRTFNRIPRHTLYPAAVAVAGPRLPELMDILRVKFPEAYEKINDILLLRRGDFPSMHRASLLINDYSPRYGIPPKTYARYVAKCVAAEDGIMNAHISAMLRYTDDTVKHGLDIPELFPAMLEAGARLTCNWSKVPESVYSPAVASGYLWFLSETGAPIIRNLSYYRWEILMADFSNRREIIVVP